MTEMEMAVYEKADDVQYMMAELERICMGSAMTLAGQRLRM